jgi:hypothetical protein
MRKSASAASSSAVSTGSSSSVASTSKAPATSAGSTAAAAGGGSALAAPPRSPVHGPARQASLSVPSSPNHYNSAAGSGSGTGTGSIPQRSISGTSQFPATTAHQTNTGNGNGNAFGPGPSYSHPRSYPHSPNSNPSIRLPRPSEAFARELSDVLQHTFIPSILPTAEEYQIKEGARKFLEGLAERVTPGAKLLPFGSQANGMALKNSGKLIVGLPGRHESRSKKPPLRKRAAKARTTMIQDTRSREETGKLTHLNFRLHSLRRHGSMLHLTTWSTTSLTFGTRRDPRTSNRD